MLKAALLPKAIALTTVASLPMASPPAKTPGIEVEREPVSVHVALQLIEYEYPLLRLQVHCSKGTYVRSLGHDIGKHLGCYAHVDQLRRVQSGRMSVDDALSEGAFSKETIRANLLTLYPLKE